MKTKFFKCFIYSAITMLMLENIAIGESLVANQNAFSAFNVIDDKNLEKLYGINDPNSSSDPLEVKNNLYQQILDGLNLEYVHIGSILSSNVLKNKTSSVSGGLNSIGFTYRRPFMDFSISADRNLAPDLFDDKRWIVTDTFSILIDASKIMSNLKNSKIIDISEQNLAFFAGIVFKRTFTWVHYASSYEEGLTTHFEKLFLSFNAFNFAKITQMNASEMLFKEDSISVNAGGLVSMPIYAGINGMGGVLAKFEKMARVEIVSYIPPTNGNNESHILISSEKTQSKSVGFTLGIQGDFIKLLKMTLLSFDFSYELSSSYKIYLDFVQSDLQSIMPEGPVGVEIQIILKNRECRLQTLAPYLVSEEKKSAEVSQSKYNFLLLGGVENSKTQQVDVATNGKVKTFFKHFYQKINYIEDFVDRLFASAIYEMTNSESMVTKFASDSKQLTIEYQSERNLLDNGEDLNIGGGEQKLSMTFSADFLTRQSNGIIGEQYRDRAVYMLDRYSGIDSQVAKMVKDKYLQAPFQISDQYQINTDGIRYLNSLSVGKVFDYIDGLCDEYPKNMFFNFRNLFDHCRRSLQNDYINYFKNLSHSKITIDSIDRCEERVERKMFSSAKKRAFLKRCLAKITYKDRENWVEIPLWSLRNLAKNIVNSCYSKVHYYNLFGTENVLFYGSFNAQTLDNQSFSASFHEGEFKGLGVIDHYMRLENLRAPSSVVIDE